MRRVQWAALTFTVLLVSLLLLRLGVGALPLGGLLAFGGAIVGSIFAYLLAREARFVESSGRLVVAIIVATYIIGVYSVGGINQPITVAAPSIPMFAVILVSARWGWYSLGVISLAFLAIGAMELTGMPLPQNSLSETGTTIMRASFILLTAVAIISIAWHDRNEAESRADKLTEIAQEDFLTNALNRRGFDMALRREFLSAKRNDTPLSLMLLDVDHFKQYNDAYGHARGDDCLVGITNAVNGCLRRPGDILARIGGDEFAAILPSTDIRGAFGVAESICTEVKKLGFASPKFPVTVTAGLAEMRGDAQISDYQLVQEADRALYRAKEAGRNQVVVASNDQNVVKVASIK